ncbi:MAG: phosphopantetheine-binding protein, partial [Acidobacteriota bacterium]|nr:phosphopantetheine-binding protein [Acidobacteriota bacterium]
VVAEGGAAGEPAAGELREHLRGRLPDYMVPQSFAALDELPLTPNGKVDRKALRALDDEAPGNTAAYVAPRTELEQKLVAIWGAVLGTDTVGVNDNFFDLGGHSLMVTKVHAQLEEITGRKISLVHLFEYPTISALAEFLDSQARQQPSEPSPEAAEARGRTRRELLNQQREARRGRRAGTN